MNRTSRDKYGKGFFHIMVQGINKKYIFENRIDKEEYLRLLLKYRGKFNITLLAYCIMDNHAHLLIYTDEVYEMSKYMKVVNSIFARNYNKAFDRVGYVFRDRFNSQYINSKEYLLKCLRYIHMNPVKANMVEKPQEYKYSTYNDYLLKKGIVDDKVIDMIFGDKKDYLKKFMNISDEEIEVMDIDRENENFMVAVNKYINEKNINIEIIKNDRKSLNEFCKFLNLEKKYRQTQIANLLGTDVKKVYYAIKKSKISPSEKRKNVEKK